MKFPLRSNRNETKQSLKFPSGCCTNKSYTDEDSDDSCSLEQPNREQICYSTALLSKEIEKSLAPRTHQPSLDKRTRTFKRYKSLNETTYTATTFEKYPERSNELQQQRQEQQQHQHRPGTGELTTINSSQCNNCAAISYHQQYIPCNYIVCGWLIGAVVCSKICGFFLAIVAAAKAKVHHSLLARISKSFNRTTARQTHIVLSFLFIVITLSLYITLWLFTGICTCLLRPMPRKLSHCINSTLYTDFSETGGRTGPKGGK